ncbi:transmembrane protein 6/97 [Rhodotorula diobovata]|uniref:Efficient mitochondria targeting-associated protein 19 n=1 Tax=Rhodotorula diobovata TaxID=5288 RepID=A0A5C5FMR8_9BASI|nr:transmembrane protein 6/97 [Rhodotorula diobovata]
MLSQRTRDWIYFWFLAVHIPATLLVDIQALFFAEHISPTWLRQIFVFAAKEDPLLTNATSPLFAWFQSFILLEVIFQLPVFFLGVRGLWKRDPSIYPLLALYGASSATTTFACIATVLHTPGLSSAQLTKLLASYVPFMLVPLCIAVDYGTRLTRVMRALGEGKAKRA